MYHNMSAEKKSIIKSGEFAPNVWVCQNDNMYRKYINNHVLKVNKLICIHFPPITEIIFKVSFYKLFFFIEKLSHINNFRSHITTIKTDNEL